MYQYSSALIYITIPRLIYERGVIDILVSLYTISGAFGNRDVCEFSTIREGTITNRLYTLGHHCATVAEAA